MERFKDWFKRHKEQPSYQQLCEEFSSLVQEKVAGENWVLVCNEPYRVLIVDEDDYHKLWGESRIITIGINKPGDCGFRSSLIKLEQPSEQRGSVLEFREPTRDEHVNLNIAWLPIPEKQLVRRLAELLRYIKGS